MKELQVRPDRTDLSFTFHMSSFISDWTSATNTFITCIKDGFRDLTNPSARDFSATYPQNLDDAWCRYRIFSGNSTVMLRAESLSLTFSNIHITDSEIVDEVLRLTLEKLLPTLGVYDRHWYSMSANFHGEIVEGCAENYLARHASREIENALKGQSDTIEYTPTIGLSLRSNDGYRVYRRTIERSETLRNGLFFATHIFVSMPDLTTFNDEKVWMKRTAKLANQGAGIAFVKDRADDDTSA